MKFQRPILVVEDDEGLNALIQRTLQREGFQTEGVYNGRDAILKAREHKEILMLLDYKLPDMTGKTVVETLIDQSSQVPFVIVTGHGDEKIAVELMKLGARDYIVKSAGLRDILPHVMAKVIDDLCQEKKLTETEESLKLEIQELKREVEKLQREIDELKSK